MAKPSPFTRRLNFGGCDVFYAVRSYADDAGAHRCDVFSPDGSLFHLGCYVVNGQTNRIGAPSEVWRGQLDFEKHPQVIVMHRSAGKNPVVLSRIDTANLAYTQTRSSESNGSTGETEQQAENDTSTEPTIDDVTLVNDESKLIMKDTKSGGDVVLAPERHFKVQLTNDGVFRVSAGGQSDDGPVLTKGYALRDAELLACIQSIVTWAQTVQIIPDPAIPGNMIFAPPLTVSVPDALNPGDVRSAFVKLPSQTETRRGVEGD
jgi:hypothetical protein